MGVSVAIDDATLLHNSQRTAIARRGPSKPAQLLQAAVDLSGRTVLDYGSGKGADVRFFTRVALAASGFDPFDGQEGSRLSCAHIVMLTYVLNVLPEPTRSCVLRCAWELAEDALVVTVRQDRVQGVAYKDCVVTKRGTFQARVSEDAIRQMITGLPGVGKIQKIKHTGGLLMIVAQRANRTIEITMHHD